MAQYRTGTATFTNGSATVTGSGTAWASNLSAGDYIVRQGTATDTYETYQIGGVTNDTTLTLTAPYGGTTASNVAYAAHIDFHPNGAPKFDNGDIETPSILNRWLLDIVKNSEIGTAAALDAQTSLTDTTANRVLLTGAGGLISTSGSAAIELSTVDSNSLIMGAVYRSTGSTTGNKPFTNFNLIVYRINSVYTKQIAFEYATGAIAQRNVQSGVYPDWTRTDPQAFGVGAETKTVSTNGSTMRWYANYTFPSAPDFSLQVLLCCKKYAGSTQVFNGARGILKVNRGGLGSGLITATAHIEILQGFSSNTYQMAQLTGGTTLRLVEATYEGEVYYGVQYTVNAAAVFTFEGELSSDVIQVTAAQCSSITDLGTYNSVYKQSNIVGTVSQSGGVPTGAIIERGSNANGEYTKFADGTLICHKNDLGLVFSGGSSYQVTWTYPATFASVPTLTAMLKDPSSQLSGTQRRGIMTAPIPSTSTTIIRLLGEGIFTDVGTIVANGYAIGRWY